VNIENPKPRPSIMCQNAISNLPVPSLSLPDSFCRYAIIPEKISVIMFTILPPSQVLMIMFTVLLSLQVLIIGVRLFSHIRILERDAPRRLYRRRNRGLHTRIWSNVAAADATPSASVTAYDTREHFRLSTIDSDDALCALQSAERLVGRHDTACLRSTRGLWRCSST
jgi:hypothetical protein